MSGLYTVVPPSAVGRSERQSSVFGLRDFGSVHTTGAYLFEALFSERDLQELLCSRVNGLTTTGHGQHESFGIQPAGCPPAGWCPRVCMRDGLEPRARWAAVARLRRSMRNAFEFPQGVRSCSAVARQTTKVKRAPGLNKYRYHLPCVPFLATILD